MKKLFSNFIKDEAGATMVEYALLVSLVSVAAVTVIVLIGPRLIIMFQAAVAAF